ncbi:TPA: LOW QUALITY PROTEIN: hypothetical protein N0F65_007333 [Lagenidium giganteum]|uniref:FYVE-type domain-containing protein n=1 Tax=Lagenidium giganteum TaxID=4803 RepID=A0AAV2Z268_9STRA|nr:TPA: LOW QUALITY PROTEIN: hypothetical protein N0F65_007333 [Lagenidium giganteum]
MRLFLIRRARESAVALVEHAHTLDGPMQWVDEGKHKGVQMYRGEGFAEDDHDVAPMEFLCGVTTMFGTIEEIAEYFDQETTLRMKAKKADDVLDCAVLYSLASASPTNPFQRVSVKYAAFEAPASLMRNRDYTYLECQDTFMHQSGRRGWVLSMHSIKLPTCPDVDGYVRGSMYHSGYVFIESSRPGYMDVMHSLQLNFKGKNRLPRFMLQAALKRRVLSVVRISREIQVTRMSQQTLLKKQELVPKNMRTLCVNCSRKFTLFIRKTRCRVCGEVVCQSCAPQMDWEAPDGSEIKKTRICLRCCNLALKQATHGSGAGGKQSEHTNLTPVPAPSNMHEYDEDMAIMDEPEDEGGMFTFDELEEQSSQSVFAPERFTRTTQVSICLSGAFNLEDMDADDYDYDDDASVRSSAYLWKTTKKGDPFYDVQQSYGGMTLPEDEEVAEVEEVIDDRQRRRAALAEAT